MASAGVAACAAVAGCSDRPSQAGPLRASITFGEVGPFPGQFSYPRAMDSGAGSLWVVDKLARVQRLSGDGRPQGEWRMPELDLGKPTGITVWDPDPARADDDTVFIADTHYHRVMVYGTGAARADGGVAPEAFLVTRFGRYGEGDGEFIYPTDVAVLPGPGGAVERLYVSEYGGNDRISIYEPDGDGYVFRGSFGRFGSGPGVEFNRPQSIALDLSRRELVVADACNHRLGRFTLSGELVAWLGGPGDEPGRYKYPYGLALLGDGTALVTEFGGCRVQRIDLDTGAGLAVYGERGRGTGQLASPWGVALLDGKVYVLDSGNNRVYGFDRPRAARGRPAVATPGPTGEEGKKRG